MAAKKLESKKQRVNTLTECVAVNLRNLRVKRNLSLKDFAGCTGISLSYVSMLERGARSLTLDMAEQIAEKLKIDPRDLFAATTESVREALSKGRPLNDSYDAKKQVPAKKRAPTGEDL